MWIDDTILERCHEPLALAAFVPHQTAVVLGSSNQAALEVNEEACWARKISILRRYGGGGTVVLYPGCVVVSLGTWVKRDFHNQFYFGLLNQALILSLEAHGVESGKLSQNGLSDIVCHDKKLVGTSLFRSRNYLLYQASILINLDLDLIGGSLRHPSREPEYRIGRSHQDFLVGLADILPQAMPHSVANFLQQNFLQDVSAVFGDELIQPCAHQFKNLLARAARGREAEQQL